MATRIRPILLAVLALPLLGAPPAAAQEIAELGETPHVYVRILQRRLNPESQTLKAGEAVGWLNYSNRIARIAFPKEVAKKMVCKQEGSFSLNGERLESKQIQSNQFATLCVLSKGEYEYDVELFSGAGTSGGGVPRSELSGRIVVE